MAFDPAKYLAEDSGTAPAKTSSKGAKFDPAKYLSDEESMAQTPPSTPAAPTKSTAVPLTPERQAKLDSDIARTSIPEKSGWDRIIESVLESNSTVGQQLADKTLMGIPGRVMRATGTMGEPAQPIPAAGKTKRAEDYLPTEDQISGVPAAAVDMASLGGAAGKAGSAIGQAPAALARKLGASEAATAVRPSLQAAANSAGAGAAVGGADAAMRGGGIGDVAERATQGAAGGVLMSQLPAVASSIEEGANNAIMSRAAKPLLAVGQGKAANKTQLALGHGDKQLGTEELKRVIEENGLEPVIRKSPGDLGNVVREKEAKVWAEELGPVRTKALEAEPKASVALGKIENGLREILSKRNLGTNAHDDVDKAIDLLKSRAEKIGSKTHFPVENLLENAKEFENDGYGKTEPKFADWQTARAIGKVLRGLTDERIGQIYVKNPKLVREVLGKEAPATEAKLLPTGEPNPEYSPPRKPWDKLKAPLDPEATDHLLDVGNIGDQYAAARKHYADLKGIEPAAEQYASRMGQERPGLINSVRKGVGRLAGAVVGGHIAGAPGAAIGMGIPEAAGAAVAPFQRFGRAIAAPFAGPAVTSQGGGIRGPLEYSSPAGGVAATMTIPEMKVYAAEVMAKRRDKAAKERQAEYERIRKAERK